MRVFLTRDESCKRHVPVGEFFPNFAFSERALWDTRILVGLCKQPSWKVEVPRQFCSTRRRCHSPLRWHRSARIIYIITHNFFVKDLRDIPKFPLRSPSLNCLPPVSAAHPHLKLSRKKEWGEEHYFAKSWERIAMRGSATFFPEEQEKRREIRPYRLLYVPVI